MHPSRKFWFVLALALGATVGELQDRMTSSEFSEWRAYYEKDPFGTLRSDYQSGQICSTIANIVSGEAFSPADFTFHGAEKNIAVKEGSQEETKAFLAAMGAKKHGDSS